MGNAVLETKIITKLLNNNNYLTKSNINTHNIIIIRNNNNDLNVFEKVNM